AVVPAPGPVHLAMHRVLGAAIVVQAVHQLLDVLAALAAGHQHGVGRLHHDDVVHAERRHQAAAGVHQRVAAVLEDHVADAGIAGVVLGGDLPDGVPR